MEPWEILGLVVGSAGAGGIITASVNAWRAARTVPVELDGTKAKIQVDLVGAAGAIIDQLQEQAQIDRDNFEARISALETEVGKYREEALEREHELENYRSHVARQDERLATQDRRIAALEAEVRRLGGDPEAVSPALAATPDDVDGTPF